MIALFLPWFGLSLWGGADTFQPADSAEFLTVAAHWGIAHPPGYPLYAWLGGVWSHLLPVSVVAAMSSLAALISLGTLIGIYATLRALALGRGPAWLGAMVAGVSLHIWKHATHPEVFALLGCLAAWLCFFAVVAGDTQRDFNTRWRAWYGYALCAGLASAHHHTIILTFPLGLFVLAQLFGRREARSPGVGWIFGLGVGCFVLGFLPYIRLFSQDGIASLGSWGEFRSFADVWEHFLRKEFGTFQSGIYKQSRPFWYHSWHYLEQAVSWKGAFPFGMALCWLVGLWAALRKGPMRWAWLALLGAWVVSGLCFPMLLQMGTAPIDRYVAARFFVLPDIFLGMFAGAGIGWFWQKVSQWREQRGSGVVWGVCIAAVVWGASVSIIQFPRASSRERRWLENYARDLLQELPKNALLVEAEDEATCFGITYLQQVRKIRTDVRFVCVQMLARRWYVRQLRKHWPEFRYLWRPKKISSVALLVHYLRLGRPVHVTTLYNRAVQRVFRWVPAGLSWRVLSPKEPPPPPKQVEAQLRRRYAALRPQKPWPTPQTAPWPAHTLARYRAPWMALVGVYTTLQKPVDAARCRVEANKEW